MTINLLTDYYDGLLDDFDRSYELSLLGLKKGNIHKMRVAIKKLRAFWKLMIKTTENYFSDEELKSLVRPLFKKAGAYREYQLNIDLLQDHCKGCCKGFSRVQKKGIKRAGKGLINEMQEFDLDFFIKMCGVIKHKLISIKPQELERGISAIYEEEVEKIKELTETLPNKKNLHKIRSQFRIIRELISIEQELEIQTPIVKKKKLKRLYEKMGVWHDIDLLIQSIEEYGKCRKVRSRLEKKQEKLEKKLVKQIRKYEML